MNWTISSMNDDSCKENCIVLIQINIASLTSSWSGQQRDDKGQAQASDMSRYHCNPPQTHVEPVLPHPEPFSHRAVFHIGPHAAGPPEQLPADSGGWWERAKTKRRGAWSARGLLELHCRLLTEHRSTLKDDLCQFRHISLPVSSLAAFKKSTFVYSWVIAPPASLTKLFSIYTRQNTS